MNGIHGGLHRAHRQGCRAPKHPRRQTLAAFPVAVDTKADGEAPATWVRVAFFRDTGGTVASRLTEGTEVYCERRLSLGTWKGRDGEAKAGANLAATTHGVDRTAEVPGPHAMNTAGCRSTIC